MSHEISPKSLCPMPLGYNAIEVGIYDTGEFWIVQYPIVALGIYEPMEVTNIGKLRYKKSDVDVNDIHAIIVDKEFGPIKIDDLNLSFSPASSIVGYIGPGDSIEAEYWKDVIESTKKRLMNQLETRLRKKADDATIT